MMQNKKQEAKEKINYIYQVLHNVSYAERKNGFHYIVWGTAISIAMILHFIFLVSGYSDFALYFWIIITVIATFLSISFYLKEKKSKKENSQWEKNTHFISLIFHFFLFLVLVILQQTHIPPLPMIFMVYGSWLLISGNYLRFKPLILGGMLNWIMALAAVYIALPYQLLAGGIVCLFSYTLPGYLLNRRIIKNV
ncbi:hypothetical protein O2K51_02950 [Apibacter raozihei]|uniref:hypothetical protein n=1 Tax=Apibacter raozihei TaxID=2500547 RepID=UPI000FE33960|nr:hypothetical protein [Apibacter raozihei]